jgi:hypothetical protein
MLAYLAAAPAITYGRLRLGEVVKLPHTRLSPEARRLDSVNTKKIPHITYILGDLLHPSTLKHCHILLSASLALRGGHSETPSYLDSGHLYSQQCRSRQTAHHSWTYFRTTGPVSIPHRSRSIQCSTKDTVHHRVSAESEQLRASTSRHGRNYGDASQ